MIFDGNNREISNLIIELTYYNIDEEIALSRENERERKLLLNMGVVELLFYGAIFS